MIKKLANRLMWPLAASFGIGFAILIPKPAAATSYDYYVELWPGGSSTLTCGWHTGPCYDDDSLVSSGNALDWASSSTITFNVKSNTTNSFFFNLRNRICQYSHANDLHA